MASVFLQNRYPELLRKRAGDQTVQYIKFDGSSADSLTAEVDQDLAYAADPVTLPALVYPDPSRAVREKVGVEIAFDCLIILAAQHLSEKQVVIDIEDAFIIPGDSRKYFVKKIMSTMQAGDQFLERQVAVSRKVGRRG